MKKLVFIVGLFTLFFVVTKGAEAECSKSTNPNPKGCPAFPWGRVACSNDNFPICCDTQEECATYQQEAAAVRMVELCEYAGDNKTACESCFKKDPPEAWTAIGCIPTTPSGFIGKFLNLGVGIAGGIAFLLILLSGFQMLTSVGNPEKLNAGKELMSSAISGLILIVFSIFLLRLIGVTILQLPEFK